MGALRGAFDRASVRDARRRARSARSSRASRPSISPDRLLAVDALQTGASLFARTLCRRCERSPTIAPRWRRGAMRSRLSSRSPRALAIHRTFAWRRSSTSSRRTCSGRKLARPLDVERVLRTWRWMSTRCRSTIRCAGCWHTTPSRRGPCERDQRTWFPGLPRREAETTPEAKATVLTALSSRKLLRRRRESPRAPRSALVEAGRPNRAEAARRVCRGWPACSRARRRITRARSTPWWRAAGSSIDRTRRASRRSGGSRWTRSADGPRAWGTCVSP